VHCASETPVMAHRSSFDTHHPRRGAASPSKPGSLAAADDASKAPAFDADEGEDEVDYPPTPPEGGGRLLQGPSFDESQSQAAFQAAVQAWRTADEPPVWRPDAAAHAAASVSEGGTQAISSGVAVEALAAVGLEGLRFQSLSPFLSRGTLFLSFFSFFSLLGPPHTQLHP